MLIEFKIQLDNSGGATVIPASANAINPALPSQKQLSAAYTPSATNPAAASKAGGDAPLSDTGTGLPSPAAGGDAPLSDTGTGSPSNGVLSSGSGTMFILGPIVICGSGPGHTSPGGDAPLSDTGTGMPNGGGQTPSQIAKTPAAQVKRIARRR